MLGQITAENLIGPGAQVTAAGIWFFFAKWLMTIHREDMARLIERMNAFHRALFLNSQATMLQGIVQAEAIEANKNVVEKLKTCLKDLEAEEMERLRALEEKRKTRE